MKEEETKTKKGKQVKAPYPFDESMRRLMRVTPPDGGTNKDYERANKEREKKAS